MIDNIRKLLPFPGRVGSRELRIALGLKNTANYQLGMAMRECGWRPRKGRIKGVRATNCYARGSAREIALLYDPVTETWHAEYVQEVPPRKFHRDLTQERKDRRFRWRRKAPTTRTEYPPRDSAGKFSKTEKTKRDEK